MHALLTALSDELSKAEQQRQKREAIELGNEPTSKAADAAARPTFKASINVRISTIPVASTSTASLDHLGPGTQTQSPSTVQWVYVLVPSTTASRLGRIQTWCTSNRGVLADVSTGYWPLALQRKLVQTNSVTTACNIHSFHYTALHLDRRRWVVNYRSPWSVDGLLCRVLLLLEKNFRQVRHLYTSRAGYRSLGFYNIQFQM